MSFNWPKFLTYHGKSFAHVGAKEITLGCPFCGPSLDIQGHYLSISLRGAGWRCFRNPRAHSGRSRSRLIQGLLRVSQEEAKRLAGEEASPPPEDENMVATLAGLLGIESPQAEKPQKLEFPKEFKPLHNNFSLSAQPFWDYLEERDYKFPAAMAEATGWMIKEYNLHYATRGPYRYRLIIPIFDAASILQTWTARSILPNETLRYKTLPTRPLWDDYDGPLALTAPGQLLLGLPLLLRAPNPEVLVLCEGPFDAFRISALGRHKGVYGTCLFGLNISEAQVLLLERLMVRFRRLVLLLDPDASILSLQIKSQLTPLPVQSGRLPVGVEDPGALPYAVGQQLVQSWL